MTTLTSPLMSWTTSGSGSARRGRPSPIYPQRRPTSSSGAQTQPACRRVGSISKTFLSFIFFNNYLFKYWIFLNIFKITNFLEYQSNAYFQSVFSLKTRIGNPRAFWFLKYLDATARLVRRRRKQIKCTCTCPPRGRFCVGSVCFESTLFIRISTRTSATRNLSKTYGINCPLTVPSIYLGLKRPNYIYIAWFTSYRD